jgi:hypothetical protein
MFSGVLPRTVKPAIEGNEIKIRITESEFIEMATKGIDDRIRQSMKIKITEGAIEVTVRLM